MLPHSRPHQQVPDVLSLHQRRQVWSKQIQRERPSWDWTHNLHASPCYPEAPTFLGLTFELDCDSRRILASVFVGGAAEILSILTSDQHRPVSNHLDAILDSKPDITPNWRVWSAAADQRDISATVHLHGQAGRCAHGTVWKEIFAISGWLGFLFVIPRFCFLCSHSTSTCLTSEVVPGWALREQV